MYYEVQVVELICIMEDDQEFRIFYDDETELDVGILTPLKLGGLNPDFSQEIIGLEVKKMTVSDDGILNIYIKG